MWFPGIDALVEKTAKSCLACQASKQNIAVDFCGPFPSGDYLLAAIDEYSWFPKVEVTKSTLKLDKMLSRTTGHRFKALTSNA